MIEAFTRSMSSRRRETTAGAGWSLALDKLCTWWLSRNARNRVAPGPALAPAPQTDEVCMPLANAPPPPDSPRATEKRSAPGDEPQVTDGGEPASHDSQQAVSSGETISPAASGKRPQSQEPVEALPASDIAVAEANAADAETSAQTSPLVVQSVEAEPNALSSEAAAAANVTAGAAQDKRLVLVEAALSSVSPTRSAQLLLEDVLEANTRCGVLVEDCLWSVCSPKYAMNM